MPARASGQSQAFWMNSNVLYQFWPSGDPRVQAPPNASPGTPRSPGIDYPRRNPRPVVAARYDDSTAPIQAEVQSEETEQLAMAGPVRRSRLQPLIRATISTGRR